MNEIHATVAIITRNRALLLKKSMQSIAIQSLIAATVGGVVGVGLATTGFGLWSLVGQTITTNAVRAFLLWIVCGWRPGFNVSIKHCKELLSFGINIIGTEVVGFLNYRADYLLIGYFLGPIALGYYNVASKLLTIMTQLLTGTTTQVALPTFSQIQKETERLRRAFYTATELTSLIAFPAFLGIAAITPELVPALFGDHWYPSIPVMRVLVFIGVLNSVFYFNGTVLKAIGKPFWVLCLRTMNAVASIAAITIAVRWGIEAVAAAFVIRGYLLAPIPLLIVRKFIGINLVTYLKKFLAPLVGCIIMILGVLGGKKLLYTIQDIHLLVISEVLFGSLIYILTIFLISPALFRRALDTIRLAVPGSFYGKT
jgi:PST family polysaccharide transporter